MQTSVLLSRYSSLLVLLAGLFLPTITWADDVVVADANGNRLQYSFDSANGPATFYGIESYAEDEAKAGHIIIADAVTDGEGKSHEVKYISGSVDYTWPLVSIVFGQNIIATGGPDGTEGYSFYGCGELTSVTLNSKLQILGNHTFYGCSRLKSINLGEATSLTTIMESVFAECDSLSSLTVPASVTTLGNYAFYSMDFLKSITFAATSPITEIPEQCFLNCQTLETIALPDAVQKVKNGAFQYCSSLKEINFGSSLTELPEDWYFFYACNKLEKLVLPGATYPFTGSMWMPSEIIFYVHPDLVEDYRTNDITRNYHIMALGMTTDYVVTTTAGGQLQSKVSEDEAQFAEKLTVSGPLNGTDINYLHQAFPNLQVLNLTDARIVSGGDKYNQWDVEQNGTATVNTGFGPWDTEDDVVGYAMFYNMPSLRSLSLPNGTKIIGDYAVAQDRRTNLLLAHVSIPSGVTEIGHHAFYYAGITEITIPEGITHINEYAFWHCEKLQKAVLPDGITFIGNSAFSECYELTDVNIPSQVETISEYAFYNNQKRSTPVVIPNSCTTIEQHAFQNNYLLPSITFGNNVETIGHEAFYDCHLIEQAVLPESITTLGEHAFRNCDSLRTFTFPQNIKQVPAYILHECDALTSVTLAEGTTRIEEAAFADCPRLTSINITPETPLTYIGNYGFDDTGLTTMTLPNSITEMGYCIFQNCYQLVSVNVPTGIDHVPYDYCENCENLKTVQMHDGIRSILHDAFLNCKSLNNITLNEQITTIEYNAFSGCQSLALDHLPEALTYIGGSAFSNMKAMTGTITIPAGVTTIDDSAFRGSGITGIVLPNNITSWGESIFNDCQSLKNVQLPQDMKIIPNWTFYNCKSLEAIDLPDGLEEIRYHAFDVSGLTSIILPDSIKKVGDYAFASCQLSTFRMPDAFTDDMGAYSLAYNKQLKTVYLGRNQDYSQWSLFTCLSGCDSVQLLRIYAGTPPQCETYYMPYRKNCVLEVPEDMVELYQQTEKWNDFKDIRGFYTGDELREQDFAVLQMLYNKLDGAAWTQPWNIENNHYSVGKWPGLTAEKVGGSTSTTYAITNIDLSNRGLNGQLDESVFKLKNLQTLNLSHNHISGDLGTYNVRNGATITAVNFEGNCFTGDLYALVSQMPELTSLNVAYNQLTEISQPLPKDKLSSDNIRLECQFMEWNTNKTLDIISDELVQDVTVGVPFELKPTTLFTYNHEEQDYSHNATSLARVYYDRFWRYDWEFNTYDGLLNLGTNSDNYIRAQKNKPVAYSDLEWHWRTVVLRLNWEDGDVNADQTVDINDLQSVIYHALYDKKPSEQMFNFTAADDNGDGTVNVIDITRSVDYILNYTAPAASRMQINNNVYGSNLNRLDVSNNSMTLVNTDAVAALQFTIDGVSQHDIHVNNDVKARFNVNMRTINGGVRVVIYSPQGGVLQAGQHELLTSLPAGASISEASLSSQEARRLGVSFEDVTTGIDVSTLDSKHTGSIYDLSGRCIDSSWNSLPSGVYMIRVNGKQYKVKK